MASFNPFPGLRPFREDEDYLFFGREAQTAELLARLNEHRFLGVVGTSGSGKSSLVRAGLLPALQGGHLTAAGSIWEVMVLRPGGDPITNLAKAFCEADLYDPEVPNAIDQLKATLGRSGYGLVEAVRQSEIEPKANLLIVVDQFEEIFRFGQQGTREDEAAAAFTELLLEASRQTEQRIYVVITMRSDYLGDCSRFPGLAEAVNDGEYLIPRLNREQRRSVIEGPVRVASGEIAPRLVDRLLNDLGDNPDQLPILQHALMRTWEVWAKDGANTDEPIDFCHYEKTGGMQQALSQHADEVYLALPNEESRHVAEKIFKALTERGLDNRGIRRPTRLALLEAIAGADTTMVASILEAFRCPGVTFLMPGEETALQPNTVIDLSHESLMRVWRRLDGWVEDESQSARIYGRLCETADLHADGKAGLYHDPDLNIAQSWREEAQPNAAWAEQYGGRFESTIAFLEESEEAERRLEREQEAARARELEQARALAEQSEKLAKTQSVAARNFKRFALGMGLVALLAMIAFALAFSARQEAQQHAVEAEKSEDRARRAQYSSDMNLVQKSLTDSNLGQAKSLLDQYLPVADKPDLRGWEWRYLKWQSMSDESGRLEQFDGLVAQVDYSFDGQWLGVKTHGGSFLLINALTREIAYKKQTGPYTYFAFSPTQNQLVIGDRWESIATLLTIGNDHEIHETSFAISGALRFPAFSPNGRFLALDTSAARENQIEVWDLEQGELLFPAVSVVRRHPRLAGFTTRIALSNDQLVVGAGDHNVVVYSIADGVPTQEHLFKHPEPITALAISPDGEFLATGTGFWETDIRIWNLQSGELVDTLSDHLKWVTWLAFSPDGKRLASASADQTIRVWNSDADGFQLEYIFQGNEDEVYSVSFRPDGRGIVSGSKGKWVRFFDFDHLDRQLMHRKYPLYLTERRQGISTFSYSSKENLMAAIDRDGRAALIDTKSLEKLQDLPVLGSDLTGVLFYPDGQRLLLGDGDHSLVVYDLASEQIVRREPIPSGHVHPMSFSASGLLVTTGDPGRDGELHLWDGGTLAEWEGGPQSALRRPVLFSPKGKLLQPDDSGIRMTPHFFSGNHARVTADTQTYLAISAPAQVEGLSISDDERYLSAADSRGWVTVWDLESSSVEKTYRAHMMAALDVELFQSGHRLVSSGSGRDLVRIWDWRSERELLSFKGTGAGMVVKMSPDDTTLAVASMFRGESTLHLWRAPTDAEIEDREMATYALGISDRVALGEWYRKAVDEVERLHKEGRIVEITPPLPSMALLAGSGIVSSSNGALTKLHAWDEGTQLIDGGADWRYADAASVTGNAWRDPEFVDEAWKTGEAPLGYGESWFKTDFLETKPFTVYFRRAFAASSYEGREHFLSVGVMYDDGVVVYLNGVEILRDGMPSGLIAANTPATLYGGKEEQFDHFFLPKVRLREGENILAAEVHQESAGSSDLSFDFRMAATADSPATYLANLLEGEQGEALIESTRQIIPESLRDEWLRNLLFVARGVIADPAEMFPDKVWIRRFELQDAWEAKLKTAEQRLASLAAMDSPDAIMMTRQWMARKDLAVSKLGQAQE